MIHHVSISAHDPKHVAEVLAELMDGRCYPFPGGVANSFMAVSGDEHGSMIEVYPESVTLVPGQAMAQVRAAHDAKPGYVPFHMLLSVPVDRADGGADRRTRRLAHPVFRPRCAGSAAGVPRHRVLGGEPADGRGRDAGHGGGVHADDPPRRAGRAFRRPRGGVVYIFFATPASATKVGGSQSPLEARAPMEICFPRPSSPRPGSQRKCMLRSRVRRNARAARRGGSSELYSATMSGVATSIIRWFSTQNSMTWNAGGCPGARQAEIAGAPAFAFTDPAPRGGRGSIWNGAWPLLGVVRRACLPIACSRRWPDARGIHFDHQAVLSSAHGHERIGDPSGNG